MKPAYVYILASSKGGTLYTGVTSDLLKRVTQHKEGVVEGFAKKHGVNKLVYYEFHEDVSDAIVREKRIKKWKRVWKAELIEKDNPYWLDLYYRIINQDGFPLSRE